MHKDNMIFLSPFCFKAWWRERAQVAAAEEDSDARAQEWLTVRGTVYKKYSATQLFPYFRLSLLTLALQKGLIYALLQSLFLFFCF